MTKKNNHLEDMIKIKLEKNLNNYQQANLFFALGKAFEDLKDYENHSITT